MKVEDVSEVSQLSIPEKIVFVEDLWDSILPVDSKIPIPDSHKNELDKRFENHLRSPEDLLSLNGLKAQIEKKK